LHRATGGVRDAALDLHEVTGNPLVAACVAILAGEEVPLKQRARRLKLAPPLPWLRKLPVGGNGNEVDIADLVSATRREGAEEQEAVELAHYGDAFTHVDDDRPLPQAFCLLPRWPVTDHRRQRTHRPGSRIRRPGFFFPGSSARLALAPREGRDCTP
jgi:hypothetical protein